MALTAAEKMRRRRDKLKKDGKYEEYKKKMRKYVKQSRMKKKKEIEKLPLTQQRKIQNKIRNECRLRVVKFREKMRKIKEQSTTETCTLNSTTAYKTRSSLGKATSKANRALPNSPRKKKMVVSKLYEKFVAVENEEENNTAIRNGRKSINIDIVKKVKKFYEREEMSRQAPGVKDVVIIRNDNGTKSKVQARHLILSIREMHQLFVEEHPDCKIGKSKFFDLRPKHVLLSSKLPRNVCLCQYHENFRLVTEALKKYYDVSPLTDFSFLCSEKTDKCWYGECAHCSNQFEHTLAEIIKNETLNDLNWYVWKTDDTGKLKKVLEEGNSDDIGNYLKKIMPHFLTHVHIKREQALAYRQQIKAALSPSFISEIAILQVDFAENYTCAYQDEVQSAHWRQKQISIFTASAWYFGKHNAIALVSDNLNHTKETVVPYVDCIMEQLPNSVKKVHIWSDGPSSQFKNRFVASALPVFEEHHRKKITWNYFATSHGKGPVDGTGGSIKRSVRNAVLKRKFIVTNANEFVAAAQDLPSKIKVLEVTPNDIEIRYKKLNLFQIFSKAPYISNIKLVHHLRIREGQTVGFRLVKDFKELEEKSEINIGDWYAVSYENKLYPGIVTTVEGNECKVKAMTAFGTYWKWPKLVDEIYYTKENMIRKIEPPKLINKRGHYAFKNMSLM